MESVRISDRALAAMASGIEKFPDSENGGIILGIRKDDKFDIVEAIEAGEKAIHETGKLTCDMKSTVYIAAMLSGLYEEELEVIGIWHKHNHNYNPPFSTEDEMFHKEMCERFQKDIISILFQKNQYDEYSMKVFRYGVDHQLVEEEFEIKDLSDMVTYRFRL